MANRTIKTAQLHRKIAKNKKKVVFLLLHLDFRPKLPILPLFSMQLCSCKLFLCKIERCNAHVQKKCNDLLRQLHPLANRRKFENIPTLCRVLVYVLNLWIRVWI